MNKISIFSIIGIAIAISVTLVVVMNIELEDKREEEFFYEDPKILGPVEEQPQEVLEKYEETEKVADENIYTPSERVWQTSGPFQIDRKEYVLGEKVFLRIGGLQPDEKGQIAVLRPLNDTHYSVYLTIPFDGYDKEAFNWYFDPQLSKARGLCSVDDVVGEWRMVFRGTEYPALTFEFIEEVLPGKEKDFEPVC